LCGNFCKAKSPTYEAVCIYALTGFSVPSFSNTQQLEALLQAREHQTAHVGAETVPLAGGTGRSPNYGKLTAAVLEAIKDRERFTSADITQILGRKPTSIWQALEGLVKKGLLRKRGRYGEAVYIKVKREEV